MKALICFIIGVLAGAAGHYYLNQNKQTQVVESRIQTERDTETAMAPPVNTPPTTIVKTNENAPIWRSPVGTSTIKEELEKTGRVIREKAREAGAAIADATSNARTTATVKSKLVQDAGLSAFKIDVDTTDGVVTLSGTVKSHDEIARAIELAMQTEGVHKVISALQIK